MAGNQVEDASTEGRGSGSEQHEAPRSSRQPRGGRRGKLRLRTAALTLGLGLWVLAPIGASLTVSVSMAQGDVIAPKAAWVSPEPGVGTRERAIGLQLQWSEATEIVAPEWLGVVQEVHVQKGGSLASGQSVALIGGIKRLAFASTTPFPRSLARDDEGDDVAALNQMLNALGIESSQSDYFTWQTLSAVRTLAEQLGVPESRKVEAFDPAWIVYLPAPEVTVASVDLQVGAPAPAAGSTVMITPQTLAAATLVRADQIPSESVTTGDDSLEDIPVLEAVSADEGEALTVGTDVLALDSTLSGVAPEALSTLRPTVSVGAPFTRGLLTQDISEGEYRVPASAVVTDSAGAMCVVRAAGFDEEGKAQAMEAVMVEVAASEAGSAWVAGPISESDRILAEPNGIERACRQ